MTYDYDVLTLKGDKAGAVTLAAKVFDARPATALVHEVVRGYLAGLRRGTHNTKTRGEVSGGGLKPWKQKHTGNARAGSIRSPLWRHGGITFGPKPRSYHQPIPVAKRRQALRAVLSDSVRAKRLLVVDKIQVTEAKTRQVAAWGPALNLPAKTLWVVPTMSDPLRKASRNIPDWQWVTPENLNAYQALWAEKIVMTQEALNVVTQRLEEKADSAVAA